MAIPTWLSSSGNNPTKIMAKITSKPLLSHANKVHWELQMTTLCLEIANDNQDLAMHKTYQENAWDHICLAIDALGLPRIGFSENNEPQPCCCYFPHQKLSIPIKTTSTSYLNHYETRNKYFFKCLSRFFHKIMGNKSMQSKFSTLVDEDVEYLIKILKILLQINHNKMFVLDQWWILFNNFKYTSLGSKENHDELLKRLHNFLE